MENKKMYLTTAEARAMGLGTVQEQIDRYNAALTSERTLMAIKDEIAVITRHVSQIREARKELRYCMEYLDELDIERGDGSAEVEQRMNGAIEMTYDLAIAVARDAGNRHMREAGRESWSVEDYSVATKTFDRLHFGEAIA